MGHAVVRLVGGVLAFTLLALGGSAVGQSMKTAPAVEGSGCAGPTEAWGKLKSSDDLVPIRNFIADLPRTCGALRQQARERIAAIETERAAKQRQSATAAREAQERAIEAQRQATTAAETGAQRAAEQAQRQLENQRTCIASRLNAIPSITSEALGKPKPYRNLGYSTIAAPIIAKHCVSCHSPGGAAPMPLLGYNTIKAFAPMIRVSVLRGHGEVPTLQRDFLVAWVEAGAPRLEGADPLDFQC